MKKGKILIAALLLTSLVGCSSQGSTQSSIPSTNDGLPTSDSSTFANDDEYVSRWELENYTDYTSYIPKEMEKRKENESNFKYGFYDLYDFTTSVLMPYGKYDNFYLLYPENIVAYNRGFDVLYNMGDETQYEDAIAYESYYVYEKSLGNSGSYYIEDELIRVSFEITAIFFPAKAGKDFVLEDVRISHDRAAVYIKSGDDLVGYLLADCINDKKMEFLMQYLKDNLFVMDDGTQSS